MVTPVTDARSNANDQIAYAANVLKRSPKLRKVFEAICRGGTKPKSAAKLMGQTGYGQVEVLQLAGRLADQQLVHKNKADGMVAYSKDRFYAANRQKILRYATNPAMLKKLPTKVSLRGSISGPVRVSIKGIKIRVNQLTCDDIDEFAAVRRIGEAPPRKVSERAFKRGIQSLIGERGKFQDWGGEPNDLFTTKVRINGKRIATAFAFKGPGTKGVLTPAKLGKNGDQIQRLFMSPADLYIVQYHDQIAQSVVEQMKAFATINSVHEDKQVRYAIIDGDDTNRLLAAYPKQFKLK